MNPDKKNNYWNTWIGKAQTSPNAKFLTERIAVRPAVEFYDLQNDPFELKNLAENPKYKTLVSAYNDKLKNWMKEQEDDGAEVDKVYKKN